MKKYTMNRVKVLLFCSAILFMTGNGKLYSQGHKVELTPFGGYLLGGSIDFYEGKFKIEDNACYGGMLAVQTSKNTFVEFSYTRLDSKADWKPYNDFILDFDTTQIGIAMNYLQAGYVNEIPLKNDAIRPYGTITLGASWLSPKVDEAYDQWFFTMALGGGFKYFFSDRVGIRLQARLILPFIYNGTYFYYGGGTVGVSTTTSLVQGDFTGGIIFVLGDN